MHLKEQSYIERMLPFLEFLKDTIRPAASGTLYYGTGESAHWPIQSNFNVAASLGILGTSHCLLPCDPAELRETALQMFRYNLRTHKTAGEKASDGQSWGNSWIALLGIERMAHGFNALEPYLLDEDRERFQILRLNEADWLLNEYQVVADMRGDSGKNKPESNIWNGGFLLRTALDIPHAPNRDAYLEKACSFLLNGISHPSDAASETIFHGKPLREWHIGANFTPAYSLDHHGYMNVGYSVICLSSIAMLHFNFKERGQTPPAELYHHVKDLWEVLRHFIFADGRLLRIGGDSRARYCYCQNYLLPVLLMVQDLYGESDAAAMEAQWLDVVRTEQIQNNDGSFFGRRLAGIRRKSYYYYTRLESDAILSLSFGAYWRRKFPLLQPPAQTEENPPWEWSDDFHTADLLRSGTTIRSAVQKGGEGPVVLCLPACRSDLAEWGGNGFAAVEGHAMGSSFESGFRKGFSGGFLNAGLSYWIEGDPWGECEGYYKLTENHSAVAVLPDGHSMIVLEQVQVIKECTLESIRGINWKIPNDVYNHMQRIYRGEGFRHILHSNSGEALLDTKSRWLNIDDIFSIVLGYGADSLKIYSPPEQLGIISWARNLKSLYMDCICSRVDLSGSRYMPGTILADTGYLAIADLSSAATPEYALLQLNAPEKLRAVEFRSPALSCRFIANFGDSKAFFDGNELNPGECCLYDLKENADRTEKQRDIKSGNRSFHTDRKDVLS